MEFCKQDMLAEPPRVQMAQGTFTMVQWTGREVKKQLHIGPKLRTSGHIPLIPLYAFIM